jgi:hypothetical protein
LKLPVPSSLRSAVVINQAKIWIENCQSTHSNCKHRPLTTGGYAPTRLIDLTSWTTWKVIETAHDLSEYSMYAALSHRWTFDIPRLTSKTFSRMTSAQLDSMAPTHYQNVFRMTRMLQIPYLWIDSLCILQDSLEDWHTEAGAMGDVYSNSVCTFSICWSSLSAGCLPLRDSEMIRSAVLSSCITSHILPWSIRRVLKALSALSTLYIPKTQSIVTDSTIFSNSVWNRAVIDAPLNQRGWVLQERLLSPRIIYLGNDQLFWECDELTASETCPFGATIQVYRPSASEMGGYGHELFLKRPCVNFLGRSKDPYMVWKQAIEIYSKCNLTFRTDKLIAISGLARKIEAAMEYDQYFVGLWRSNLLLHLLWRPIGEHRLEHEIKQDSEYIAPSWSWASFDGPIAYGICGLQAHTHYTERYAQCFHLASIVNTSAIHKQTRGHYGQLKYAAIELECYIVPCGILPTQGEHRFWNTYFVGASERSATARDALIDLDPTRGRTRGRNVTRHSSGVGICDLDRDPQWSDDSKTQSQQCFFLPLICCHSTLEHFHHVIEGLVIAITTRPSNLESQTSNSTERYVRIGTAQINSYLYDALLIGLNACEDGYLNVSEETRVMEEAWDIRSRVKRAACEAALCKALRYRNREFTELQPPKVKWKAITLV